MDRSYTNSTVDTYSLMLTQTNELEDMAYIEQAIDSDDWSASTTIYACCCCCCG